MSVVGSPFSSGPVIVEWDAENCPVPKGVRNAEDVPAGIRKKLRDNGYNGDIFITAAVSDQRKTLTDSVLVALQSQGVQIAHYNTSGEKELADYILLGLTTKDVLSQVPPPATIFVISGDYRFASVLEDFVQLGYNAICSHARNGSTKLSKFVTIGNWDEIVV